MITIFPIQHNSLSEKKNGTDWFKNCINYGISQYLFQSREKQDMIKLYEAANGDINLADYTHVTDPYNTKKPEYTTSPAKVRRISIIKPLVELYLGENTKKPDNFQVVVTNLDSDNSFKDELNKKVEQNLQQQVINKLNDLGVQTGKESKTVLPVQQLVDEHKSKWNIKAAVQGQEILDYIKYAQDLDEKFQEALSDWIKIGRFVTFKYIEYDDVKYQICNPLNFWCQKSTTSPFIEDGKIWVYAQSLNISEILDRFRAKLKDDEIEVLENLIRTGNNQISSPNTVSMQTQQDIGNSRTGDTNVNYPYLNVLNGTAVVYHTQWKTMVKVGILSYVDSFTGEVKQMDVDENYTLDKEKGDIDIKWEWNSRLWEGYRIGENIFPSGYDEVPVQRDDLNNTSICKSGYNGRYNLDRLGNINSPVKQGLDYEALYKTYHYRFELIMAKNKEKLVTMPIGLIPNKQGWNMDKFMHYIDTTGIAWVNETAPNFINMMNGLKTLDLSLANYVKSMIDILKSVKDEYWDAVGMNRQRYGDVNSSDGKGNNEQAIFRSAIITSELYRKFDKTREKDYEGLLDYSKLAFSQGKKAQYMTSDGYRAMLDVDVISHANNNYNVFIRDRAIEESKFETAKQLAVAASQKTGTLSQGLEILDSNNFAKVKDLVAKAEEIQKQLEQAQAQQNNETQLQISENTKQIENAKLQMEKYKVDMNYKGGIEEEIIRAKATVLGFDKGMNGDADANNIQTDAMSLMNDTNIKNRKLDLDERKLNSDREMKDKELKLKNKQIESAEKIAKMNKN